MNIKSMVVTTILGVILLSVGIFVLNSDKALKERCTVKAVGTVVDNIKETDYSDDTVSYSYYPVIEYEAEGKIVSKKGDSGSSSPSYSVGDKIDVLYNPSNVEEFIISGDNSSSIIGIVFLVISVIILAFSLGKVIVLVILYLKNK